MSWKRKAPLTSHRSGSTGQVPARPATEMTLLTFLTPVSAAHFTSQLQPSCDEAPFCFFHQGNRPPITVTTKLQLLIDQALNNLASRYLTPPSSVFPPSTIDLWLTLDSTLRASTSSWTHRRTSTFSHQNDALLHLGLPAPGSGDGPLHAPHRSSSLHSTEEDVHVRTPLSHSSGRHVPCCVTPADPPKQLHLREPYNSKITIRVKDNLYFYHSIE